MKTTHPSMINAIGTTIGWRKARLSPTNRVVHARPTCVS